MKPFATTFLLLTLVACSGTGDRYDATGTFETTEVVVSAEASGRLLCMDVEEGMKLEAGQAVGQVDTVQLYLKKLQLEASARSVSDQRPDIRKQIAATQEQIRQAERERDRVKRRWRPMRPTASSWTMPSRCSRCCASSWRRRTPPCRTATVA